MCRGWRGQTPSGVNRNHSALFQRREREQTSGWRQNVVAFAKRVELAQHHWMKRICVYYSSNKAMTVQGRLPLSASQSHCGIDAL